MKVLIACECSGIVREAFRAKGHDAWSCDLKPSEDQSGFHYRQDVFRVIRSDDWDMMIAHPPCDYLAVSGNRWFSDHAKAAAGILTGAARREARDEAVKFVDRLWKSGIPRICIENPIGRLSTLWRKSSQRIQPWQFWTGEKGKGEVKGTCLWLKGMSPIVATSPNETGRHPACWLASPGENRKTDRSRTYPGIAVAMAEQWGEIST